MNGRVDGSGHEKRYWLIMRRRRGIAEVFTVWVSGEKALPVFSFRGEAEMYLWFEAPDGGWQIGSRCGRTPGGILGTIR